MRVYKYTSHVWGVFHEVKLREINSGNATRAQTRTIQTEDEIIYAHGITIGGKMGETVTQLLKLLVSITLGNSSKTVCGLALCALFWSIELNDHFAIIQPRHMFAPIHTNTYSFGIRCAKCGLKSFPLRCMPAYKALNLTVNFLRL